VRQDRGATLRRLGTSLFLALCLLGVALPHAEAPYFPTPGQWTHKTAAEVGMDGDDAAVLAARLREVGLGD